MCISPISKTLGQPRIGRINPETASTLRSRLRCVNYRLTGNRPVAPVIPAIVSPTKRSPVQANPCFYFASIKSRSLHNIALPAVLVPCVSAMIPLGISRSMSPKCEYPLHTFGKSLQVGGLTIPQIFASKSPD